MSIGASSQLLASAPTVSVRDDHLSTINSGAAIDSSGADGYFGSSSTFAFVSKVSRDSPNVNGVHLQHGQPGSSESTSPQVPYKISGDDEAHPVGAQYLPDRKLADDLVDAFFDQVHPLCPFMHEGSFRGEYEDMWEDPDQASCRLSYLALMNAVFALGVEFSSMVTPSNLVATVTPFVSRAREIVLAQIHRRGNLELLQALLLLCYYLSGTIDINECWNLAGLMNRTAFSIGLHLNPDSRDMPCIEKEVRKRVWWGCFVVDTTISLKCGRPGSMHLEDARNVPYPLPVDDQYIQPQTRTPRQPSSHPSSLAFFIHNIKLSQISGDILRALYSDHTMTSRQSGGDYVMADHDLAELIVLDGRLRSWWNSTPAHLHPASQGQHQSIIRRQQAVLRVRYLQILILLQRPMLLMFSRQQLEDEMVHTIAVTGAQACVAAALQSLRVIQEHSQLLLSKSNTYNLHALFTSTSVLVHVLNMDPDKGNLVAPEGMQSVAEALECGMDFLQTASQSSLLAARCIAMLNHVRAKLASRTSAPVHTGQEPGDAALNSISGDWAPGPFADSDSWLNPVAWRFLTAAEIDLDGLEWDRSLSGF